MKNLTQQSRVAEIADVARRIAELYKNSPKVKSDPYLGGIITKIEEQSDKLIQAIDKDKVRSNLEEIDAQRDEAVRSIGNLLGGYQSIPLPSLKAYAQRLSSVFEKYGARITGYSYTEESAKIDALLKDLSDEKLSDAITGLQGVREAITHLDTQQKSFAKVRAEYEAKLTTAKSEDAAYSMRKPLLNLINKNFITYLEAMALVNKDNFGVFIAKVSEIIESVNVVVKARSKKNETKENKI